MNENTGILSRDVKFIIKNQMEILLQNNKISEIFKNSLDGLNSIMEIVKIESVNLDIHNTKIAYLCTRKSNFCEPTIKRKS